MPLQTTSNGAVIRPGTEGQYIDTPEGKVFDGTQGTDPISQLLSSLFGSNSSEPVGKPELAYPPVKSIGVGGPAATPAVNRGIQTLGGSAGDLGAPDPIPQVVNTAAMEDANLPGPQGTPQTLGPQPVTSVNTMMQPGNPKPPELTSTVPQPPLDPAIGAGTDPSIGGEAWERMMRASTDNPMPLDPRMQQTLLETIMKMFAPDPTAQIGGINSPVDEFNRQFVGGS